MMWLFGGAVTAAAVLFALGLGRAAKDADMHAQHPPLDELERLYAEPDRYCPACGGWLAGDDLFDSAECQAAWMEDA